MFSHAMFLSDKKSKSKLTRCFLTRSKILAHEYTNRVQLVCTAFMSDCFETIEVLTFEENLRRRIVVI